jgi:hypothetical protein
VALTVGTWKEMTLTNLQANATNELDLSAILPGAKMAITKLTSNNGQFNLQASLKGTSMVKHLVANTVNLSYCENYERSGQKAN